MDKETKNTKPTNEELNLILDRMAQIRNEIQTLNNCIFELERQVSPLAKKRERLKAEFKLLDSRRFNLDGSEIQFVGRRPKTKTVSVSQHSLADLIESMTDSERLELLASLT